MHTSDPNLSESLSGSWTSSSYSPRLKPSASRKTDSPAVPHHGNILQVAPLIADKPLTAHVSHLTRPALTARASCYSSQMEELWWSSVQTVALPSGLTSSSTLSEAQSHRLTSAGSESSLHLEQPKPKCQDVRPSLLGDRRKDCSKLTPNRVVSTVHMVL